jgi:hypothetical protein
MNRILWVCLALLLLAPASGQAAAQTPAQGQAAQK